MWRRAVFGWPGWLDLLMFDEPTLGLAPAVAQEMLQIIRLNQGGITVVLVEQYVAASPKLAQEACVLENGPIVLSGGGAELPADYRVRKACPGF